MKRYEMKTGLKLNEIHAGYCAASNTADNTCDWTLYQNVIFRFAKKPSVFPRKNSQYLTYMEYNNNNRRCYWLQLWDYFSLRLHLSRGFCLSHCAMASMDVAERFVLSAVETLFFVDWYLTFPCWPCLCYPASVSFCLHLLLRRSRKLWWIQSNWSHCHQGNLHST